MKKAFLNWSSGKDAAFALYLLQQDESLSVEKLFTTINSETDRVSMHGVRRELLKKQAESIGLPLQIAELPGTVPLETYNEIIEKETSRLISEGYSYSVFGDIFLEDLKAFREKQLAAVGLEAVFPLWRKDTFSMIEDFIQLGFKAITVSVSAEQLDPSFCGRVIDRSFLRDLPKGVDPCGENGEFHSFVFDGPNFSFPISYKVGEIQRQDFSTQNEEKSSSGKKKTWDTSFYFCDLIPA